MHYFCMHRFVWLFQWPRGLCFIVTNLELRKCHNWTRDQILWLQVLYQFKFHVPPPYLTLYYRPPFVTLSHFHERVDAVLGLAVTGVWLLTYLPLLHTSLFLVQFPDVMWGLRSSVSKMAQWVSPDTIGLRYSNSESAVVWHEINEVHTLQQWKALPTKTRTNLPLEKSRLMQALLLLEEFQLGISKVSFNLKIL